MLIYPDTVLFAAPADEQSKEEVKQYLAQYQLSTDQVRVGTREGMRIILAKVEFKLERN